MEAASPGRHEVRRHVRAGCRRAAPAGRGRRRRAAAAHRRRVGAGRRHRRALRPRRRHASAAPPAASSFTACSSVTSPSSASWSRRRGSARSSSASAIASSTWPGVASGAPQVGAPARDRATGAAGRPRRACSPSASWPAARSSPPSCRRRACRRRGLTRATSSSPTRRSVARGRSTAAIRQSCAAVPGAARRGGTDPGARRVRRRTPRGATTTLGRGGSDYTAALVGAGVRASEVQIWTDVDGVFTADPRVVDRPSLIPCLSFHEAYELARFGAKVLHWGTLEPAASDDIPVRVLNAQRPRRRGHRRRARAQARRRRPSSGSRTRLASPSSTSGRAASSARCGSCRPRWSGWSATVTASRSICLSPTRLVVASPDEVAARAARRGRATPWRRATVSRNVGRRGRRRRRHRQSRRRVARRDRGARRGARRRRSWPRSRATRSSASRAGRRRRACWRSSTRRSSAATAAPHSRRTPRRCTVRQRDPCRQEQGCEQRVQTPRRPSRGGAGG